MRALIMNEQSGTMNPLIPSIHVRSCFLCVHTGARKKAKIEAPTQMPFKAERVRRKDKIYSELFFIDFGGDVVYISLKLEG